ncbi:mechanosensitive ion channel domain-containing protein [Halobacterium yunchengense]|uniref:mechanosensitive ion channel domain-containing protein n=1 Tax=Halobacterium yunchengense TaxID=3108497 RepID=UPI0030082575
MEHTVEEFLGGIAAALPRVLAGLVFLALAALVVRALVAAVRAALDRVYPAQPVYVQLGATVAGVYLLRDIDFNPGDRVVAGGVEGVVRTVELRKTRFDVGGDTVVRANADVEQKWTRKPECAGRRGRPAVGRASESTADLCGVAA